MNHKRERSPRYYSTLTLLQNGIEASNLLDLLPIIWTSQYNSKTVALNLGSQSCDSNQVVHSLRVTQL